MASSSTLPPSLKLTHLWPIQDQLELARRVAQGQVQKSEDTGQLTLTWPTEYRNARTGRTFKPHNQEEQDWLNDRKHRYLYAKGGEGSGKTGIGVRRDLDFLKLGVSGILASPDLPHFKKSLWPEFKAWCPWDMVVPNQQYRGRADWEPHDPFTLTFKNGAQLICGGMENPASWEGPNVTFAHLDEARRLKTPDALKVLDGRVRIPGPNGETPQLWITSTPKKHWLYEYFGPWDQPGEDPRADFKALALVITLKTLDNEMAGNLATGYTTDRARSLNEAEQRVLLEAEWEDIEDVEHFLASILWWDACHEGGLKPADRYTPLVLGVDGAESNDNFALVAVSRHPDRSRNQDVAIRYSRVWEPGGRLLDFEEIENEIYQFCRANNVVHVAFDKFQLLYMMERLYKRGIPTESFNQGPERAEADKQLLDLIVARHVVHDGTHAKLRQHLDNADKKKGQDGKLRIVKREQSLKVDLAVATSMAVARCLYLNLYG
jgi:hypothetical protein